MTPEEQREFARELGRIARRELAELNRPKRERKLRRGLAMPRNRAEWEIFGADLRKASVARSWANTFPEMPGIIKV
jgi:hypothetical protein